MGPGRYFVHVDQETFRENELNQQLTRTITRTRTYNTTSGALDLETVTTQAPSGATYTTTTGVTLQDLGPCLGLPDFVSVTRSAPNVPTQTRTVDNVFSSTCRLSSSTNTSETAAAMQLKTSYTYDGVGNTKTITINDAGNTAGQERKKRWAISITSRARSSGTSAARPRTRNPSRGTTALSCR
jgi:hypothetical protein